MALRVARLSRNAVLPRRATPGSVGYDLCAIAPETILPGERAIISTGLAIALPEGTYGRVAPRSGLALRHGVDVMAGVIDADYRGEVKVVLVNLGNRPFQVAFGDRVAQLILERVAVPEVEEVASLDSTPRDAGGFGSTGN